METILLYDKYFSSLKENIQVKLENMKHFMLFFLKNQLYFLVVSCAWWYTWLEVLFIQTFSWQTFI